MKRSDIVDGAYVSVPIFTTKNPTITLIDISEGITRINSLFFTLIIGESHKIYLNIQKSTST